MPRLVVSFVLIVTLWCLAGCTVTSRSSLPARLRSVPGSDSELFARLERARGDYLRGDAPAALLAVEEILEERPQHTNAHRLRQDILRQRGRIGLVLAEAESRIAQQPGLAASHYLAGRIADLNAAKQAAFEQAIELDRGNFWGYFGLAFTLRETDNARANQLYSYLYAQADQDHNVALAYAQSLRVGARFADAYRVYHTMRREHPGIGALGMAETLVRTGKPKNAWKHLLTALGARPHDPGVRGVIRAFLNQGIPDDGVRELLDVLRADPERMQAFAAAGPSLLAAMLSRVGESDAALQVLSSAETLSAVERRDLQRLLITGRGVAAFLADVEAGMNAELLEDEGNQVRGRWLALLGGPWMDVADPLAELPRAVGLIRALMHVGYLEFAELIVARAILRHGAERAELVVLRDEIRREIAFESGLRRILTRGYVKFAQDDSVGDLQATFDKIREHSKRTLGRDVVGEPKLFDLPFVGVLVDSMGPGLPAHLARYNKHLVLGQRNARPTEGMILTRLSVRHVDPVPEVPLPPRTTEVVGEHRQLEPLEQADLAGIALLNHYVIDMDEVRSWSAAIARRRRIAREDGEVVLRDPLPEGGAATAPIGVEWRLSLVSPVEDKDLESAVLDIIRWHERGHMVDFLYFLPVTAHPFRSLALAVRNGLTALGVASEMEGRAELCALAMSPHTQLVAAHVAGFLTGDGGTSPHAHGFRDMIDDVVEELQRREVEHSDVRSWHRLDPQILRDVARHLLARLW